MDTKTDIESRFTKRFMFSMIFFGFDSRLQTFTIELLEMSTWLLIIMTLLPILPLIWAFFIFRARFLA
jgi:hypothetical protein